MFPPPPPSNYTKSRLTKVAVFGLIVVFLLVEVVAGGGGGVARGAVLENGEDQEIGKASHMSGKNQVSPELDFQHHVTNGVFPTPEITDIGLSKALAYALTEFLESSSSNLLYLLQDVRISNDFAYAVAQGVNDDQSIVPYEIVVVLARRDSDHTWHTLTPSIADPDEYNILLSSFPDELLDDATKAYLSQPDKRNSPANFSGHKLPWPAGQTGYMVRRDVSDHENQVDFDIPGDVYASKPGTVVFVKESSSFGECNFNSWRYANMVVVQHSSGEYSWYVHLAHNSAPVSVGDSIGFGTKVGVEGSTGYSCDAHLHYMASTGHTSWTDPNQPAEAPWATGPTAVDFVEVAWSQLTTGTPYTSQNGSGSGGCSAPNLVSPGDGETVRNRSVHLDWNAPNCSGLNGYTLHVTTGSGPEDGIIKDTGVGPTEYDYTFPNDGTFYWHVAAWVNGQRGPWASRRIVIDTTQPGGWAYQLFALGDFNGEKYESNQTIRDMASVGKNDWAESMRINSGYGIVACTDADFRGTCGRTTGPAQFSDINAFAQGLRHGLSSIRVCAGSCPEAPGAPSLSSPGNGSSYPHDYDLTFNWNSTARAESYLIEWWGGPYQTMQPCGWISGTSCHIGTVAPGNTYSWHVKARNGEGESGWSETWTFSVQSQVQPPDIPSLRSPANGATLRPNDTVVLEWNASARATEYAVEYQLLPSGGWQNSGHQPGTSWNIGQRAVGEYEWHVEAYNSAGWSNWSGAWHFTVQAERPSANFDAWPQSGNAPLTVAMHIVSTANISSCSWNYGDGQTGSSCDAYHNHIYTSPGVYSVRLSVSGPGGSDEMTRANYINVTSPQDTTPPSADGFSVNISGRTANLTTSGVRDNAGGSGVREVRFSARYNGSWQGIGTDSNDPYSLAWDMCAAGAQDGDIEFGMEVWDNANNKWVWSEHHGNPHATKSYNCNPAPWTWSVEAELPSSRNGMSNGTDASTSACSFVYTTGEWSNDFVAYDFTVPSSGYYYLWARAMGFAWNRNSFFTSVDNGVERQFEISPVGGEGGVWAWNWQRLPSNDSQHRFLLEQGSHTLRFRSREADARLDKVLITSIPDYIPGQSDVVACSGEGWLGEYFANENLSGSPILTRYDPAINFEWTDGPPGPGVPADHFSIRWTRTQAFDQGHYRFTIGRDDGARLWINDILVFDEWQRGRETRTFERDMTAGAHRLRFEMYEFDGWSMARLGWEISDPDDGRILIADQTLNGSIDPATDEDSYFFDGSADQIATLRMTRSNGDLDGYLILYAPNGDELRRDDDSGGNNNPLIDHVSLPQSGRYRVLATSFQGASIGSYTISLSIGTRPPPAPPSNLRASATGAHAIHLTWVESSGNPSGYRVWRTFAGLPWENIGSVSAETTSFDDGTNLGCGVEAFYMIQSFNQGGASAMSNNAFATTWGCWPGSDPAVIAPTNLNATYRPSSSIVLNWQDRTSNEARFKIMRTTWGNMWYQVGVVNANVTSFLDTEVGCGYEFYYKVRAERPSDGSVSEWAFTSASAPACTGGTRLDNPSPLSVGQATRNSLRLQWRNTNQGQTAYQVQRAVYGSGWYQFDVPGGATTSYTDAGLSCDTRYYYRVRSVRNTDGAFSEWSNFAQQSTAACTGAAGSDGGRSDSLTAPQPPADLPPPESLAAPDILPITPSPTKR